MEVHPTSYADVNEVLGPFQKTDAARWALESLPAEWSPLIAHAMEWRTGDRIDSIDRTMQFIRYVIESSAAQ